MVYRPNGAFFTGYGPGYGRSYGEPITIDTAGAWAVAVQLGGQSVTTSAYQLEVSDGTCGVNDSWEPNDTTGRAAGSVRLAASAPPCVTPATATSTASVPQPARR